VKPVVFSGVKPSGALHIGNYLGAISRWAASQDERDNIFCVVDLHAVTVPQDPMTLHRQTRNLAALYIASGLDPQRSAIFVQSHVSAHAELAWLFNCITPMGWMRRMTQFKEKSESKKEEVSVGLFAYPALMAADILLYHANLVPVGEDQKQHVELTRDIAIRFNGLFGETFTIPAPEIAQVGARIMSLQEPSKKMSKSDADAAGTIDLLDPPDVARKKIMRAKTDALSGIVFDPARDGLFNLLSIYQLLSRQSREEIESHFAGQGYAALKRELADLVIATLEPLQARYREITADPTYLESILADGANRVRPIAEKTLADAKGKMGLG
jgi:tryptophanyl-tRNA synthetase